MKAPPLRAVPAEALRESLESGDLEKVKRAADDVHRAGGDPVDQLARIVWEQHQQSPQGRLALAAMEELDSRAAREAAQRLRSLPGLSQSKQTDEQSPSRFKRSRSANSTARWVLACAGALAIFLLVVAAHQLKIAGPSEAVALKPESLASEAVGAQQRMIDPNRTSEAERGNARNAAIEEDRAPAPRGSSSAAGRKRAWYEGGTLHKAKIGEWFAATGRDRLATSADFVAAMMNSEQRAETSLDELRSRAAGMMVCISKAGDDPRLHFLEVGDVAAACSVLMAE